MPVTKKKKISRPRGTNASIATFLERPLPDAEEVLRFEAAVEKEALRDDEEDDLSAIYHDGNGQLVDVSKVNKRKRLRIIVLFKQIFVLTILACALYGAYYYFFQRPAGTESISLAIAAPEKALAGEVISYRIEYRNNSGLALSDVKLEAILPESFVLTNSEPAAEGINSWPLGNLERDASGVIMISGYLIAPMDSANIITGRLTYTPENFSSGFKKEASANTVISGLGFGVTIDYLNTALLGQDNELKLNLNGIKGNMLTEFYLDLTASDNVSISKVGEVPVVTEEKNTEEKTEETLAVAIPKVEASGEGRWLISGLAAETEDRFTIPITFKLKEKKQEKEDIRLRFFKKEADGSERVFWEKTISVEVMKSDLNLSLSLNGEKTDKPVDFGSTLNYSLSYSNNGDSPLYDLVLMAVVKGDAINWSTLRDPNGGRKTGDAIVWSKEEISALAEVGAGESGVIDFTLKLKDFAVDDLAADASITSYAQYGLNNSQSGQGEDNKSNTIKSLLNSDMNLSEKILYFDEDNRPVGTGPLPPRVGETTTVKVYWTIKNNLHDLKETEVVMELPAGVQWAGNEKTPVGTVSFDESTRIVTWRLGYLPLSVYRAEAEFSISLTPAESDRNKIMVLSGGSTARATDVVTSALITHQTSPKTTKLEDDEIAGLSNSGRVE